jgi:hypothetical protein
MESLRQASERVPAFRQGHQYDLAAGLTFLSLAMMGGCNGERQIARWGQHQRWLLAERLGFRGYQMPSLGTIQRVLRQVDGAVLGEVEGAHKTNEINAIHPLLADLVLEGRVVTVDALLTQRQIAQAIVEKGARPDAGESQSTCLARSASGVV